MGNSENQERKDRSSGLGRGRREAERGGGGRKGGAGGDEYTASRLSRCVVAGQARCWVESLRERVAGSGASDCRKAGWKVRAFGIGPNDGQARPKRRASSALGDGAERGIGHGGGLGHAVHNFENQAEADVGNERGERCAAISP